MVRTFQARSTTEALRSIKGELGPDAMILRSRTLSSGMLEVEATRNHLTLVSDLPPQEDEPPPVPDLRAELEPVRELLRGFLREAEASRKHGLPPALTPTFVALCDAGVGEGFARSLAAQAVREEKEGDKTDELALRRAVRRLLARKITCAGPLTPSKGERLVVAFVGPTGVGKTTMVSKIAAVSRLQEGRRVGLIAADANRLGAVEQVRRCADILGAPFAMALTREALREALAGMSDAELVLIDTPGRSARDGAEIDALSALFERPPCRIERQLCLAATSKERDNLLAAERFRAVGYQRLLFTKLDDTDTYGGLYALPRATRRPLSYLSRGANIPADLEVASPESVAELILPSEGDADVSGP
jgi:flagellar biosynthesis protein FlhF